MASQFEKKYFQYQEDLHTNNEHGRAYVRFFIQISSSSQMYQKEKSAAPVVEIGETDPDFGKGQITWKATKASAQRQKRVLQNAITLYIPNDLSMTQSAIWQEEDLSMNLIQNADEVFGAVQGNINAQSSVLSKAGQALGGAANAGGSIAGSVLLKMPGMQGAQKIAQITPGNAKVEQLFQGVDFRTFNFNYTFNPKSPEEATNVMRIIQLFRHHMLPEFKDDAQYLYIYPQTFDIKYYMNTASGEVEHPYLDRHFTQVCTSCTVNYTPLGQHVSFANGMPAHINLQLQFKELSVHTKDTMKVWPT